MNSSGNMSWRVRAGLVLVALVMVSIPSAIMAVRITSHPRYPPSAITENGGDNSMYSSGGSNATTPDSSYPTPSDSSSPNTTPTTPAAPTTPSIPSKYAGLLEFSGYYWKIKDFASPALPGPNIWSKNNVWVDDSGNLHLKVSNDGGVWSCAELQTADLLGFGTYEFQITGHIDSMDPNVVFAMFTYPLSNRPRGTDEIDMEFSRWGNPNFYNGFYGAWGADPSVGQIEHNFYFSLPSEVSTYKFVWDSKGIYFETTCGGR